MFHSGTPEAYNLPMILQSASIVPVTEAEGPGRRFALWFQGCPLRCPGCCNPEYLPFQGGQSIAIADIVKQWKQSEIEGITLLGGEPFAHAEGAAALAREAQSLGLSVMVFTGYLREELEAKNDPATVAILASTDILVDGPYERERPDTARRWIGSTNQRIHFLTPRYRADDPCWQKPNTLEIRVRGAEIVVNGFPAIPALGLWKGWKRKSGAES